MKTKLIFLLILGAMTLNFYIAAQTGSSDSTKKILVAFYSFRGNTKAVTGQTGKATKGGIFHIEPVPAYLQEYYKPAEQAKKQVGNDSKPAIKNNTYSFSTYDIIFIVAPNRCSTVAAPEAIFLSGNDLPEKTIIPFTAHKGSHIEHTTADIKKLWPRYTVLERLPIHMSNATNSQKEIKQWLQSIKIIK